MEGWNSWRVASMGLLNIGRQEGSHSSLLFGRGVRLKGKDMSLKRSAALEGGHPQHLRLLETLNIFAVRANYMAQSETIWNARVWNRTAHRTAAFIRATNSFLRAGWWCRARRGRGFAAEVPEVLGSRPQNPVQWTCPSVCKLGKHNLRIAYADARSVRRKRFR